MSMAICAGNNWMTSHASKSRSSQQVNQFHPMFWVFLPPFFVHKRSWDANSMENFPAAVPVILEQKNPGSWVKPFSSCNGCIWRVHGSGNGNVQWILDLPKISNESQKKIRKRTMWNPSPQVFVQNSLLSLLVGYQDFPIHGLWQSSIDWTVKTHIFINQRG